MATDIEFALVLKWLTDERSYQKTKFDYEKQLKEVGDNSSVSFWIQQFDSYIQRLPPFGFDTPQGVQAALKLAATSVALCEYLMTNFENVPAPGVPSGEIKPWWREGGSPTSNGGEGYGTS